MNAPALDLAVEIRRRAEDAGLAVESLTDSGNAARLVGIHGPRLHYVPRWGKWVVASEDGFWTVDHKDVCVRELAKAVGERLKHQAGELPKDDAKKVFNFAFKSLDARGITGMVDLARGIEGTPLDHEKLDANGWLLGVENGVIDLREGGEFRAAEPSDLITLRCPVLWDENDGVPLTVEGGGSGESPC